MLATAASGSLTYNRRVEKPWGHEILLAEPSLPYAAKLLFVASSHRLSLQRHDRKVETLTLLSGAAALLLESSTGVLCERPMTPNVGYTVLAGRIHRISALTDAVIMEASTPEAGITERLHDDYARTDEDEAERDRR